MSFISIKNLTHKFNIYNDEREIVGKTNAINDISLNVNRGEFIVILGHNGSGKSTLARHLNNLLYPDEGSIWIDNIESNAEDYLSTCKIREKVGMVFQNPDNQIIGTTVEEDAAFGPENLCVESEKIKSRIDKALAEVDMQKYRYHAVSKLSGGQKQRVAIAGILAMNTECIVLDEATAMLDPQGRKEVLSIIKLLNKQGKTIIHITHEMEEATYADKVFVMKKGKIMLQGSPEEVFNQTDLIKQAALDIPVVAEIALHLRRDGYDIPANIFTVEQFTEAIANLVME